MKKIDIHCHSTPRKLQDVVPESASISAIRTKMEEHEIERTALLASYFPHKSSGISNYRLQHWIKGEAQFMLVGSLDVEHYFNQGYNELEELASEGALSGIKIYTCYQQIDLASEKLQKVGRLAERYELPIMFHVGHSYSSMRTTGNISVANLIKPSDVASYAERHPTIPIVLAHMGKPFFDELVQVINSIPTLYTDMSGLIDSKFDQADKEGCVQEIRTFLELCGSDKLLFGTDFPIQTHEDTVYMLEKAMRGFSEQDKEKVYYQNAERLLLK